jgi:hypothetical protein
LYHGSILGKGNLLHNLHISDEIKVSPDGASGLK